MQKMEEYHWPGNVRELRNVVERAVALGDGPMLDAERHLAVVAGGWRRPPPAPARRPTSRCRWRRWRSGTSCATLEHTDWNKSQAAAILQIERSTLDRKIKGYELKR